MLTKALRSIIRVPSMRLKPHEKPELNPDFIRYEYGNYPNPITSRDAMISHGFDYGSESYDYEDHSMHVLHQRPNLPRYTWPVFGFPMVLVFGYYVWQDNPFIGMWFGSHNMDIKMNALKAANNDEGYHDWDAIKATYAVIQEAAQAAEEEGEAEEEAEDEAEAEEEDEEIEAQESSESSEESEE